MVLLSASLALGASVSVNPSSDGVFIIQGNSMDGVAGIDLTVVYDTSSLASPKIDQGSLVAGGALFAANPNFAPSTIKIIIISARALSGSGQIAVITFASHTGTGSITVSTSMIDSKGAAVPGGGKFTVADFQTFTTGSTGFISSPGAPFSKPPPVTTTANPPAVAPTSQTYLGTVSMPADVQARSDTKPADTSGIPEQFTEPAATTPVEPPAEEKPVTEPQKPEKVKLTAYKGTLENFRVYKGEKSPAILVALVNNKIAATIRQEPAVALSDGKTTLKILVKLETANVKSPNFALDGAKLVSLNKDDAATWIVEALPQANIVQASLTILTDSEIIEYPLTLAPPVEGVSPAEADFVVFLNDSGAATPKRDLNGDGKHDYLDDYIYTANYLIRKGTTGKVKK